MIEFNFILLFHLGSARREEKKKTTSNIDRSITTGEHYTPSLGAYFSLFTRLALAKTTRNPFHLVRPNPPRNPPSDLPHGHGHQTRKNWSLRFWNYLFLTHTRTHSSSSRERKLIPEIPRQERSDGTQSRWQTLGRTLHRRTRPRFSNSELANRRKIRFFFRPTCDDLDFTRLRARAQRQGGIFAIG